MLRPTAIYRAIELDVPAQWLGAIGASFALVPLLLAVPTGFASDRFGERRVMLVGSLLTVAASGMFVMLGDAVWGLLAACIVLGTGHLCSVVGQQALVANRTRSERYDTAFGRYTFAASAGQAVGPGLIVVFGGAASIPDVDSIFVWSLGLSCALMALTVPLPSGPAVRRERAEEAGSIQTLLRRPGLVQALTVSCVVLAAVDISLVYLPVLGIERDLASWVVGVLLSARAAASMVSRFFLGRLSGWLGRGRLLTTSIALAAGSLALLPLPFPPWALIVIVVIAGLGLGAGQPLTMSWLAEATPPGLRGRAMSLRLTGNRLGQVVVPTMAGLLAAGAGAAGVLWLTAAALAAVGMTSRRIAQPTHQS